MFKSIFKKQFFICVSILLISFIILSTIFISVFEGYFIRREEALLIGKGQQISALYEDIYTGFPIHAIIARNRLNTEIRVLYDYLNASFFLVDAVGHVVISTSPDINHILNSAINEDAVPDVRSVLAGNQITTQGLLGGIFEETKLTVGYPITIRGEVIGAIFMSISMLDLQQSISDVTRVTGIYMVIFCLIASLLIYISSTSTSKSVKEINEAAKIIANGNLKGRINVNSKDEVGQLAQSFNNMAVSLEKQESTRQEFIDNISHDIKSPLTSIRGFLEAIIDGTIPKEKYDKYLNIILDECIRLDKLANNLLYVSSINYLCNEEMEVKGFNINQLIIETVVKFDNVFETKKISINLQLDKENYVVFADYVKIQRVVYNLLDNALKFTKDEGSITIKTVYKQKKLYISIKDTGEGISKEQQSKIFDRFYKVDSSRGKDKVGSGLGLSIVKAFINAHNEEITVNSALGKGSEFIFTLNVYKDKNYI